MAKSAILCQNFVKNGKKILCRKKISPLWGWSRAPPFWSLWTPLGRSGGGGWPRPPLVQGGGGAPHQNHVHPLVFTYVFSFRGGVIRESQHKQKNWGLTVLYSQLLADFVPKITKVGKKQVFSALLGGQTGFGGQSKSLPHAGHWEKLLHKLALQPALGFPLAKFGLPAIPPSPGTNP